jgi:hypothetical protein
MARGGGFMKFSFMINSAMFNPLNAELNSICYLLALLGAHLIFHVSRIRVNLKYCRFGRKMYLNRIKI